MSPSSRQMTILSEAAKEIDILPILWDWKLYDRRGLSNGLLIFCSMASRALKRLSYRLLHNVVQKCFSVTGMSELSGRTDDACFASLKSTLIN